MRKIQKPSVQTKQKSIRVLPTTNKKGHHSKVNNGQTDTYNNLYFGDCLDVLKDLHRTQNTPFIDLIYIDPPFNSKRNYNVLFENIDMKDANAQKQAFADTWSNVVYIVELNNLADLNKDLFDFLSTFDKIKSISNSAVAYLTTMAHRIWYMHKLLKNTGSFYLHCDPTMSHYLKIICDMIFGDANFRNEITWQRSAAHSDSKTFANNSDILLYYSKSNKTKFNTQYQPYTEEYLTRYKHKDSKGVFLDRDLTAGGLSGGGYEYTWKGVNKTWRCPIETMKQYEKDDLIYYTRNGTPRMKQYLHKMSGVPCTSIWIDIPPINSQSQERLGYPTQKPEPLMERIINTSTDKGDVVADFFCGCGTTISVAQKLERRWLGSDISHLAIKLVLHRLVKRHGKTVNDKIKLHGLPRDIDSAKMLARETDKGRFNFQDWVIEVLLHGVINPKKVGDGGYDGYLTYLTDKGKEFVLIETKSGGVNVKNLREFIQVVDKQKAAAGIFVCFNETVTREMLKEAKIAGTIALGKLKTDIDKIQILTVDDLLQGKQPHLPNVVTTFRSAERVQPNVKTGNLFD